MEKASLALSIHLDGAGYCVAAYVLCPTHPWPLALLLPGHVPLSLSKGAQSGADRLHPGCCADPSSSLPCAQASVGSSQLPPLCLILNHSSSISSGCSGCGELLGGQAAPGQPLTIARPPPTRLG